MATLMISLPGGRDFTPIRKTKKRSFAGMRSTTF
jgi:hypothetical protein